MLSAIALQVIDYGSDEGFFQSLGITKQRFDELTDLMDQLNGKYPTHTAVLAEASKHCKDANELATVGVLMGMVLERNS